MYQTNSYIMDNKNIQQFFGESHIVSDKTVSAE
jgi:hypothetical protein